MNDVLIGRSPLIILTQYIDGSNTVGFKVCDWKGKVVDATVDFVIKYAELQGIANGAIKELENRKIVSPIRGEYDKTTITNLKMSGGGRKQPKEQKSGMLADIIVSLGDNISDKSKYEMIRNQKIGVYTGGMNVAALGLTDDKKEVSLVLSDEKSILDGIEIFVITSFTKVIDNRVIEELPNLKRIIIQEGVESLVGTGINGKINVINEITFPSTLKTVESLFNGRMDRVERLDMSHTKLEVMGYESFARCKEIKDVRFPRSSRVIDSKALGLSQVPKFIVMNNFEGLREWTLSPNTIVEFEDGMKVVKDELLYGREMPGWYGENCDEDGFTVKVTHCKNIVIPDSIEVIGKKAFYFNEMESLRIPKGIKEIRSEAFMGCSSIKTIDFKGCRELVKIDYKAFAHCRQIESVDLRDCVKLNELSEDVFDYCYKLRELKLNDNLKHMESVILERVRVTREERENRRKRLTM